MKKKLTFDIFDIFDKKCQLKTFQKGTKNENFFCTKMSIMSNVKINFTHFTKNTEIQNGMYVKKMYILYLYLLIL